MVLFYGLLALETANNKVAAAATTSSSSQRESLSKKIPMSSSSNSWIYTEDLKKRFEERYGDYRYIFVPIYIDGKSSRHNHSTTAIIPEKFDLENSWMYSRSFRNHLFNSTSSCCVINQGFMRDELPIKKSTINLTKNRTNLVLEEEEDDDQNHSIPLIKHNSVIPSHITNESSNNNSTRINNELSNTKHMNRLTRLRSFFFKSSSSLSGTQ